MFGVILVLGEHLISYLCLGVKSRALVLNAMAENLDALKWWWLGVFIAPTTKPIVGIGLLSMGAPDSPARHRTLFGAPATSPGRWIPTVGASVFWATGQSGGAPDSHCSLSGAPSAPALNSARAVAHC